jgi:DNA repair exonuclease SbcCD ATPase subunit
MHEEKCLIAELKDCDDNRRVTASALSHPQHSILIDEYEQLAKVAELARGKVDAVRVRLRSLRTAKLRKKDSHDLHQLQNALNELAEEIDTITYAGEAGKEHTPSPEESAARNERYRRLEAIRDKLTELTLVMVSVDGKPRSLSHANAHFDMGEALQKLRSAESNLDAVETHLNNAEGAHADDQDEIASAKSAASEVKDALEDAKAALGKAAP